MSERFHPVGANGDAMLRGSQPGISSTMDNVFKNGYDNVFNGFTVTNGDTYDDGTFHVFIDKDGSLLAEGLSDIYSPELVAAYGERLDVLANPDLSNRQSLPEGESRPFKQESLALNAKGELGKPNVLAYVDYDETQSKRTGAVVELNGEAWFVVKRERQGQDHYFASRVQDGEDTEASNSGVSLRVEREGVLSTVEIRSTSNDVAQTITAPGSVAEKAPVSESRSDKALFKGILRKKAQKDSSVNPLANRTDFDIDAATLVINREIQDENNARTEQERQQALQLQKEKLQEDFNKSTSIAELSARNPEAGNMFNPEQTIFDDEIFNGFVEKHGAHIENGTIVDSSNKPIVLEKSDRDELKQYLRTRLDAWVKEDPAMIVQRHFDARISLDETSGISPRNDVVDSAGPDSLLKYVSSERRTIANMRVPEGPRRNDARGSEKPLALRREDDPNYLSCRQNAVNIAFDMLVGQFDTKAELNIHASKRLTDASRKVLIHDVFLAQHRATARMILYGEA